MSRCDHPLLTARVARRQKGVSRPWSDKKERLLRSSRVSRAVSASSPPRRRGRLRGVSVSGSEEVWTAPPGRRGPMVSACKSAFRDLASAAGSSGGSAASATRASATEGHSLANRSTTSQEASPWSSAPAAVSFPAKRCRAAKARRNRCTLSGSGRKIVASNLSANNRRTAAVSTVPSHVINFRNLCRTCPESLRRRHSR